MHCDMCSLYLLDMKVVYDVSAFFQLDVCVRDCLSALCLHFEAVQLTEVITLEWALKIDCQNDLCCCHRLERMLSL